MACCKCDELKWPDPQPPVHTDEGGKQFCLFHAPAHAKGMDDRDFNLRVVRRIQEAKRSGARCVMYGAVFPGLISFRQFDKDDPLPEISFFRARFCSGASFVRACFADKADFSSTRFDEKADFSWARFNADAGFIDARFMAAADFRWAQFETEAYFNGARFSGDLRFVAASVNAMLFWSSTFPTDRAQGRLSFAFCKPKAYIRFVHADLSCFRTLETDLERFRFEACRWPVDRYGDYVVHEDNDEPSLNTLKQLEFVYRTLKGLAQDGHDEIMASAWHFKEKSTQYRVLRAASKRNSRDNFLVVFLWLYNACSGYGERPGRALCVLASLLAALFVCLAGPSFVLHGLDCDSVVRLALSWAQLAVLLPRPELDWLPPAWQIPALFLARVLVPLQAALFGFALRNKFRR